MTKTTALFIGRFQPLHKGHIDALEDISKRSDKIIIVIGSSRQKNTKKNPFSLAQRKKMLALALKKIKNKIKIISLPESDFT